MDCLYCYLLLLEQPLYQHPYCIVLKAQSKLPRATLDKSCDGGQRGLCLLPPFRKMDSEMLLTIVDYESMRVHENSGTLS